MNSIELQVDGHRITLDCRRVENCNDNNTCPIRNRDRDWMSGDEGGGVEGVLKGESREGGREGVVENGPDRVDHVTGRADVRQ